MRLVSLLKEEDTIDFAKLELSNEISKNSNIEVPHSQAGTYAGVSLRPQTEKSSTIIEKIPHSPGREIMKIHSETMERLFGLTVTANMIVDKSGIYPRIHFLQ